MKNIDLENLNLVELTNHEQREIDGGQDEVTKTFWYYYNVPQNLDRQDN